MSKQPQEFNAAKSNFGFRGWIVVIYMLMIFLSQALVTNSITNISSAVKAEQFGWSHTSMLSWSTYAGWITVVLILVFGQVLRKNSPKRMVLITGTLYTICVFLYPSVNQYWQYVLIYSVIAIIGTILGQQFNAVITANWFPRKKGLVMGWTTIGMPLGAGIGVLLYNMLSGNIGLSGVYYLYGGVYAVTILCCALFVTDYPEQVGAFPDNDTSMTREKADAMLKEGIEAAKNSVWTVKAMLSIKETWLIGIGAGIQLLFAGGFMNQMVPRLLSAGFAMNHAIMGMTAVALIACVGSYLCGIIDAKIGPRKAIMLTHIFAVTACVLNIIPSTVTILAGMLFVGVVMGGAANYLVSIVASYWGRYDFANAHKVLLTINQLIGASGTMLIAQTAARYSYTGSYILVGCIAIVGFILMCFVKDDAIAKHTARLEAERDGVKAEVKSVPS